MGMITAPTGETAWVPDNVPQMAPVAPVPDALPQVGQPPPLPGAPQPDAPPWMPPQAVIQGAQSGFQAPDANSPDSIIGKPYQTVLDPGQESDFDHWVKANRIPFKDSANNDYDMRGFYKALQTGDPRALTAINQGDGQVHFPDIWKTPFHKTISNESIYAPPDAPHWVGDKLVTPLGQVVADETPKASAKQAAYARSPAGMQDAAVAGELAVNKDQQASVLAQGDIAAKQADEQAAIKAKQVADEQIANQRAEALRQERMVALQKEHDRINATVVERSKDHVDPGRMWHSMSTGQHVQAGIGILLAGIGQGLNGDHGANPAMKLITDAIDRDTDAQKINIELGNKTIDQELALYGDSARLADRADDATKMKNASDRLAVADQYEAASLKYAGPVARNEAQKNINTLRSQAYQITGALADQRITQQQKDQELATQRASVGVASGHLALANRQFVASERDKDLDRAEKGREADERAAGKAAGKLTDKERALSFGGNPIAVKDADGNIAGFDKTDHLVNENGTPALAASDEEAKKLRPMKTGTDQAIAAIDKMRQIRADSGWTSDTRKSPAWQRAHAEYGAALKAMLGSEGVSRLTPDGLALMKEQMGNLDDVTRAIDPGPGLDQAREGLVRNLKYAIDSAPGNNVKLDYPDPIKAPTAVTPDAEKLLLELAPLDTSKSAANRGDARDISDDQRRAFENLVRIASTPGNDPSGPTPKERKDAYRQLQGVADDSESPRLKAAAATALLNIGLAQSVPNSGAVERERIK